MGCRGRPSLASSLLQVSSRRCSKTGCSAAAVATLTYVYADSTAVVGPLALRAEPGSYDLCATHCEALSSPRGWELIRLPLDAEPRRASSDDLLALADAVREVGMGYGEPEPLTEPVVTRRRGHLAVVADLPVEPR